MNLQDFKPARMAIAIAAAAVVANLFLMLGDALAPQAGASARSATPSSVEAARGRFPGESKANTDAQRWKSQ